MAVPETTLWDCDPHTEAKHQVLAGYFDAWYPIMLRTWPRLTIFEGYAGPGEHTTGEEGSPIIALRRLLIRPELVDLGKQVRFVFVEKRDDRLKHLRELVAEKFPDRPSHIRVDFVLGSCEEVWKDSLTDAGAWGFPIFANLDPFGPAVPFSLVERVGGNGASEVLVTFMSDYLRRFASVEALDDGDRQFGGRNWRKVVELADPQQKELFLVAEYQETLVRAGFKLSAPFRLSDEGGHSFYVIFATGHRRGLERMKDSMWKIDPARGIQFRDTTDANQGVLDFGKLDPDLSALERRLKGRLSEVAPKALTADELRDFALLETGFRSPHATRAIRTMLDAGELSRNPKKGQLSGKISISLV